MITFEGVEPGPKNRVLNLNPSKIGLSEMEKAPLTMDAFSKDKAKGI